MTDKRLAGPLIIWAALFVLGGAGVCLGAVSPAPDFTLPLVALLAGIKQHDAATKFFRPQEPPGESHALF